MEIRWLTAFVDRPAGAFDAAVRFWQTVTASSLSAPRGEHGEFATLLPPDGDAYLRVQRTGSGAGWHLDLHVPDIAAGVGEAVAAGARVEREDDDVVVMASPAAAVFCIVGHDGEAVRPAPVAASGHRWQVDQLCLDIPPQAFDAECAFWAAVTGWPLRRSTVRPEFARLAVPDALPLRLLMQRCDERAGPAGWHLDLATDDKGAVAEHLASLGATRLRDFEGWNVLADPAGVEFCATGRKPAATPR